MPRRTRRTLVEIVCLAVTLAAAALGAPDARAEQRDDLRLVVLIVVDQFRADYLTRFARHFTAEGFNRLTAGGAHFENACFSYASTATAPGHATLVTGRLPRQHGIVANEWYLDPIQVDLQSASEDPNARPVSTDPGADRANSPWRLIGATLGDQMKIADARAKVVSVALKARAAVFMGGRKPDAAIWWNDRNGYFESSTYYGPELPRAVAALNNPKFADRYLGKVWERALADATYAGCRPTDPAWIGAALGLGAAFPHTLPATPDRRFYAALSATPFGNDLVLALARTLIETEKLGADETADLLCIGLSSFDVAGHIFGPESPEMLDFAVRTDRQLADFLAVLDKTVGRSRCLIVLTADHGVSSIPMLAAQRGLDAGQIDLKTLWKSLNAAAQAAVGSPVNGREYVSGIVLPWVYLDRSVAALDATTRAKITRAVVDRLRATPGIADVFTAAELAGPPPSPEQAHRWLAWRCFHPHRSGDLFIQLAPNWYKKSREPAGHTTGYNHDRHVPIVLCGPGIRPGRYFTPADPMDIAVTVAALLGIEPPLEATGRVLNEALDSKAPR